MDHMTFSYCAVKIQLAYIVSKTFQLLVIKVALVKERKVLSTIKFISCKYSGVVASDRRTWEGNVKINTRFNISVNLLCVVRAFLNMCI